MSIFSRLLSYMPKQLQFELRRVRFRRQIANGSFVTTEPEFAILPDLIGEGDWIIDVGANVGHYTKRFSELVGPCGRVLALEPVAITFAILSENVRLFAHRNVTLLNVAASSRSGTVGMVVPQYDNGITNYYQAHLSSGAVSEFSVLAIEVDSLDLDHRVSLVKVDAEGHEPSVVDGMWDLISRDRPTLILESADAELLGRLCSLGYSSRKLPQSPNVVLEWT